MVVDYVRYYAPSNVLFWTGAESAFWTNSANWIAGRLPSADSDLTFSYLSTNTVCTVEGYCVIKGLVFLQMKRNVSINGTSAIQLGADGIDMSAANQNVSIGARVNIATPQTWVVGPKTLHLDLRSGLGGKETLTKSGLGTLVLGGEHDFTGGLNVDSGTLLVNGTLAANPLVVRGTLCGDGTLSGRTVVGSGGVVAPGSSRSTLTFSGSLNLSSNSTVLLQINALLNDRLKVVGPLNYGGTLSVTNISIPLKKGDRFKLFEAESYRGAFEKIDLPPLPPGLEWNTQMLTNGFISVVTKNPQ
jgi:autotransporter-associated beta strand protein